MLHSKVYWQSIWTDAFKDCRKPQPRFESAVSQQPVECMKQPNSHYPFHSLLILSGFNFTQHILYSSLWMWCWAEALRSNMLELPTNIWLDHLEESLLSTFRLLDKHGSQVCGSWFQVSLTKWNQWLLGRWHTAIIWPNINYFVVESVIISFYWDTTYWS